MPRRRIAAYNGLFILLALVICLHPALAKDPPGCQAVEPIPPSRQHLPESPVDIQVEVPGTPDANLLPYMGRLIASIAGNLRLRLPGSVASAEEGTVVIRVQVRKDGSLSRDGLSVACTSGIKNIDATAKSAINLIRASNPNDEIFVVNFSQDSYLDQDFTSDINLLQQALQKVSAQGSTALYDAIVASAVHLKNNTRIDRKVLLVITDGRDNASQETLQEAAHRLQQENGPTLYAIGLLGDELQQSGTQALQSLADSTGGVAFFPRGLDEVDEITRTVARDIRSQYTIGYKPTNPRQNAGYRTIEVRAQAPGYRTLTVRTRSGYYAGEAVH